MQKDYGYTYWKEQEARFNEDVMRVDEIKEDTLFALVGQYVNGPCAGISVWFWANGLQRFVSGLLEIHVRETLALSLDETLAQAFEKPLSEYVKYAYEQIERESEKTAIKEIASWIEEYEKAFEKGCDLKQVQKFMEAFFEISNSLSFSTEVRIFEGLDLALAELQTVCEINTDDDLQEIFYSYF